MKGRNDRTDLKNRAAALTRRDFIGLVAGGAAALAMPRVMKYTLQRLEQK